MRSPICIGPSAGPDIGRWAGMRWLMGSPCSSTQNLTADCDVWRPHLGRRIGCHYFIVHNTCTCLGYSTYRHTVTSLRSFHSGSIAGRCRRRRRPRRHCNLSQIFPSVCVRVCLYIHQTKPNTHSHVCTPIVISHHPVPSRASARFAIAYPLLNQQARPSRTHTNTPYRLLLSSAESHRRAVSLVGHHRIRSHTKTMRVPTTHAREKRQAIDRTIFGIRERRRERAILAEANPKPPNRQRCRIQQGMCFEYGTKLKQYGCCFRSSAASRGEFHLCVALWPPQRCYVGAEQ